MRSRKDKGKQMQWKKILWVLWVLPVVSGCTVDTSNARRLKLLALEECVDNRERSVGNQGKSHGLLFSECEQIQSITESQQSWHRKNRHSIPEEQEYFNEKTWSLVTERMREVHYPQYLASEEEVKRASSLNANQDRLEDQSVQRIYEPRLLPVSPYLMNRRELGMASSAIGDLIYENRNNPPLHRSLSTINVIVLKEIGKRERRH